MIFHALQDSRTIPAVERLSRVAVGFYGFWGLILLNRFAFLSSVPMGMNTRGVLLDRIAVRLRRDGAVRVPARRGRPRVRFPDREAISNFEVF
jgi:hypothetical protein